MKTADNNAMAIAYEGNDFDCLETAYNNDGKTSYKDIMNAFVKETRAGMTALCHGHHRRASSALNGLCLGK